MGWFVYLVSEHGDKFCKVGRTSDVAKRVGYLRTSNPRKLDVVMTWQFPARRDAIDVERIALELAGVARVGRSEWLSCGSAEALKIIEGAAGVVGAEVIGLGLLA